VFLPCTSYSSDNLESISVSTDVSYLLSNLSTDKATSPDEILYICQIVKIMSNEIAPSMTALFNKSLSLGKVPQEWKEANVVPIPKKGNIHEVVNYRPISLLSLVSKLLEQVVNIHVDLSRLLNLAE
jgi:flagellar biosynthesis regulator FlbT